MDTYTAASLDKQGARFGISQHSVDKAKAVYMAVESGEMSLPMDETMTENALMHGYLLPCLDLMIQYPDFIGVAVAYATAHGLVISEDREVSIFEIL